MILAIDPGKHGFGMAWFTEKYDAPGATLYRARYAKIEDLQRAMHEYGPFSVLHLERQYLTKKHPRPSDIVELAFAAGYAKGLAVEHCSPKVIEHLPIRWKGNVPKDIHQRRILSALSSDERAWFVEWGYTDKDTVDAIGIGLFALGRLK